MTYLQAVICQECDIPVTHPHISGKLFRVTYAAEELTQVVVLNREYITLPRNYRTFLLRPVVEVSHGDQ